MTFFEIYNQIIPHWGDRIDFSDGDLYEQKLWAPETAPLEHESFQSDSFSKKWEDIEKIVGYDDTFGDLMVWTMYQVFHEHARQLFRKNIFVLYPKDISKTEIENQYYNNLQTEGWEKELSQYERITE